GYRVGRITNEWRGLLKRGHESLETPGPGTAVGTATFFGAIQHERGDSASAEDVTAEIESVVKVFQAEAIGGWSEAGEIVSIELVDAEPYRGNGNPWTERDVA